MRAGFLDWLIAVLVLGVVLLFGLACFEAIGFVVRAWLGWRT